MVLEYEVVSLKKITKDAHVPRLTVYDIKSIVETSSEGTVFPDVPLINAALRNAIPAIEFDVDLHYRRFEDILDQLRNEQPVIPLLQIEDAVHSYGHSVVVRGFDRAAQLVLVNDPLDTHKKPSSMATPEFMRAWDGGDRYLIKVKIGGQKRLTDDYRVTVTRARSEVPRNGGN
jgi:hypothetical protein